jgi:predicted ATPase
MARPATARKPRASSQARIELILAAASDRLSSQGFAGLTIYAVAERAEIPPSSVYHFFASVPALLEALTADIHAAFRDCLLQPVEHAELRSWRDLSRVIEQRMLAIYAGDSAARQLILAQHGLSEVTQADRQHDLELGRLMQALFDAGVLFVITSNYPPSGLYPNGLQRERLLPTLALLEEKLDVIKVDAGIDYRLRALEQAQVYLLDENPASRLMQLFAQVAHGEGHARPLMIAGREIPVVHRAPGVAWFDFNTLCGGPRSQNDYLDLAHNFHTLMISGMPRLTAEMANAARRFTWLVDVCYDHRVKLVLAAEVPAEALYVAGPQASEFGRTVSRLIEMRSHEYLASTHRRFETHEPSA